MPLKIRQKKQPKKKMTIAQEHSSYSGKMGTDWKDQYREDNQQKVKKSFIALIAVMAIIVLILIFSAVTTFITTDDSTQQITAADTFAVTSYEQQQMSEASETFAKGLLIFAYCSDEATAEQGKQAALSVMANNTESYTDVQDLEAVDPIIAPENFLPVVTEPVLQDPTIAYAGDFTWEFNGVAADGSVTSEENPNGTFADSGYHFKLTFSQAQDENSDETRWLIVDAEVQEK